MFYSLSIPLHLGAYFISKGTLAFNSFRTFCALKSICQGHLKRTPENIKAVSVLIGISERTISSHIDWLIENRLIRYNPQTNTCFLIGWEKMANSLSVKYGKAVVIEQRQLKNLKFYLFSGNANCLLKAQKTLPCLKNQPKEKPECIQYGTASGRGKILFAVNGYQSYNGISCSKLSEPFVRSRIWSSRMKEAARKLKILSHGKSVLIHERSREQFNRKALSLGYELTYQKSFIVFSGDEYLFVERMADNIRTSVCTTRKRLKYNG